MENYLMRLGDIWGPDLNDSTNALRWIEGTVQRQDEEGLYLDFKQKSDRKDPAPNDDDKANLAKAISGFANTDGGLIVWGVKAKADKKDDPDVAVDLMPIGNLKTFQTALNSLSGGSTNPPVGGVENRIVTKPDANTGYVITVVPTRRDSLVQANSKNCKGIYIRSGSGFHQLAEPFIAEFYRRKPAPILRLSLTLADAKQTNFAEEVVEAEHYKPLPWGRCSYRQSVALEWSATLKNEGLGSAGRVALDLRVSGSNEWQIISHRVEEYHLLESVVYAPVPTTHFIRVAVDSEILGKVLEPIHPGQSIKVAHGALHIPFEAFETTIADFEVSGYAYATDSPPFRLECRVDGSELRARYLEAFEAHSSKAPPSTRKIPRRRLQRINVEE